MNPTPKHISVAQKKACIADILDNGVPIHAAVLKHQVPAVVINKWLDAIDERDSGGVADSPTVTVVKTKSEPVVKPTPEPAVIKPETATGSSDKNEENTSQQVKEPVAKGASEQTPVRSRFFVKVILFFSACVLSVGVYYVLQQTSNKELENGNLDSAIEIGTSEHPTFHTPITYDSFRRFALKTNLIPGEDQWFEFEEDELYLQISSNKFPPKTYVLMPVKVGEGNQGTISRYMQLPFEVNSGDKITFKLIEEDGLEEEQSELLFKSFETAGFCIGKQLKIYAPSIEFVERLTVATAADQAAFNDAFNAIGEVLISRLKRNAFEPFGEATYIVPDDVSTDPSNPIEVPLNDDDTPRLIIQIYAPDETLQSQSE
jgi:hypothetical protein